MTSKQIPASELLQELAKQKKGSETVSLGEISDFLSERGFAILMILFAFPMAIPLPYPPGFTTILGLPLLIFSIQMILKMSKPLLPKWMAKKTIKTSHLIFAIEKSSKYFVKAEKILKPRLPYFSSEIGERIIGVVALLCSIAIVLPILFGNSIPSAGILIMSLGLLGRDGVVIILGIVVSIISLFVASMVVFLFFYGAKMAAGSFLKGFYAIIMERIGNAGSVFTE
jgi:hypothetical protein